MKLKALVAALAIIGAGAANAGYVSFTDTTARGELFFTLTTSTASAFFDLGIRADQFSYANFGGVAAGYTDPVESLQVTWNFNTGTVTSTGQRDVSSLLAGISGDWSAAWNAYSSNLATSTFAVGAGDRDGTGVTQQKYLSTSSSLASAVANTTNGNLINFNSMNSWHLSQQLTGGGNHATVTNGANVITDTSSGLYNGADGAMKTNWNDKASFTSVGNVGTALDFYALDGKTGGPSIKAAVTNYNGKFAVDAAAGTLTWTTNVAAVPEPSTYAMLLAGLGLMGVMVRRRVK